MLINHENSQKIAERIGGILHRNVNIMDEEGRIVASTDPTRIGALHEAACKLIEQNIPEMDVYSIDQMTGSREGINLPLQIDGKTIGVIGVTGNPDELRDIGLVITEMAEILFSETLQTLRQQSISRQRRHFLEQLLFSTPTAPSESFERRGRALGVPLHHIRSVGVLSIDAELQDADTAAFYDTLLSILRSHLGDSILLNHLYLGKKLILFLGADIQPYLLGQLNKALRAAQAAGHVSCCGIAGGCESYTQLHRIYTQADKALEVALSSNNRQVCVYDGLVLERSWGNAKKDMEEMLDFLEIYFACNGSVQAISQKLFIHKNTVQYKIKKIAEATGYDPRKLSDAVLLYLCVRLRKA